MKFPNLVKMLQAMAVDNDLHLRPPLHIEWPEQAAAMEEATKLLEPAELVRFATGECSVDLAYNQGPMVAAQANAYYALLTAAQHLAEITAKLTDLHAFFEEAFDGHLFLSFFASFYNLVCPCPTCNRIWQCEGYMFNDTFIPLAPEQGRCPKCAARGKLYNAMEDKRNGS